MVLAARLRRVSKDLAPKQREVLSVHPPFLLNDFPLPNEFLFQKHCLNSHDYFKDWAHFLGWLQQKSVCLVCLPPTVMRDGKTQNGPEFSWHKPIAEVLK